VAPDILRHRLVLSYDALADDVPADQIIDRVLSTVPLPTVAPRQNATPVSTPPSGNHHGYPQTPAAAQAATWPNSSHPR
jgi:MoxR-like ATPase